MTALVHPFLATIAPSGGPRAFASALEVVDSGATPSPWSPRADATPAPSIADLEALRREAREAGRAEGRAETQQLRERLAGAITAAEARRVLTVAATSELVADAACAVIAAWTAGTDRRALFAPIVTAWMARALGPTTARVHPEDVAALRALVDHPEIEITADPTIAPGDVVFQGATGELAAVWDTRLQELRTAIATAVDEVPA